MSRFIEILFACDWMVICAYATLIVTMVTAILYSRQISLSKQQNFLNKRLTIWLTTQSLLELYKQNQNRLTREEEPQFSLDEKFAGLTNNAFLYEIGSAAFHPLDMEYQKPFLVKLDEIKALAAEAKLVFEGELTEAISEFLNDYQQLLMSIYQYQALLKHVDQYMSDLPWAYACAYEVNEPLQRSWLYEAYDSIEASYTQLNSPKLIVAAEKQIRLTRK